MSSGKIVYIGSGKRFDEAFMASQLSMMNQANIQWFTVSGFDSAMEHFFASDPILLLLVEDAVPCYAERISEIKADEVFQHLPIVLVLPSVDSDTRKISFSLGIGHFLEIACDTDEMVMACHSAIHSKIKLDSVMEKLRLVSEENITRSIQLDILKRYLPLTIWYRSEFLAESQEYEIAEEEMDLAILFADIRGFSTYSESMAPRNVVEMLNKIFDLATSSVYQNGGDIDKFIGDALLAVFPRPSSAIRAALALQSKLIGSGVQVRVGVHYGRVIRGSVGGNDRWDYTLIGDAVNTAQRLESLAPPGGILASRYALEKAGLADRPLFRFKSYRLKGKSTEIVAAAIVPRRKGDAL